MVPEASVFSFVPIGHCSRSIINEVFFFLRTMLQGPANLVTRALPHFHHGNEASYQRPRKARPGGVQGSVDKLSYFENFSGSVDK